MRKTNKIILVTIHIIYIIKMDDIETERKKYTTRGTSGFENIGNTCYMNSTLQCLGATDLLVAYFTRLTPGGKAEYVQDLKHGIARMISEEIKKRRESKGLSVEESNAIVTIDGRIIKHKFRESLTYQLRILLITMWGENCSIKPREFKSVLERESKKEKKNKGMAEFSGYKQCDSQECFSFIIDRVHEETLTNVELGTKQLSPATQKALEIKNTVSELEYNIFKKDNLRECAMIEALESWGKYISKSYSIIEDIFGGMTYQSITCQTCGNASLKFDPFRAILLPIPDKRNVTIDDCFEEYFQDEKMEGENKTNCDICKCKTESLKVNKIWQCPYRLMICFKRFDYSGHGNKNNKKIMFPIEGLDMNKYMSGFVNNNNIYDLYAISYHSGGVGCGHYTAYTLNAINNEWYHHDDAHVMHIDKTLTGEEFINFFEERLSKNDNNKLQMFVGVKSSLNKKSYGLDECKEFLEKIECANIKDIMEDFKEEMNDKITNVLVTPGAYWLLYKKREQFKFASYASEDTNSENEISDLEN